MFKVLLIVLLYAIVHSTTGTGVVAGGGTQGMSESETSRSCSNYTLYILSLLPYPDDNPALQPSWDEGPTLFLAEQLAVEHINNRHDILQDYHLELVQGDSGCNIKSKAILAFVGHVLASGKQIVGIVGPGCSTSTAIVSPLSGRNEIALPMIHIAGSLFIADREKYPYSFGTLDSTEVFVDTLVALMKRNSWHQVATLYDESRVYFYSTLLSFEQKVRNLPDYNVALSSAVYDTYIPFSELEQARVRVIFLLVGPDFLGKILCLAYHKDFLYPKYQWVMVGRTFDEVTMETEFNLEGKHYSCTKDELKKAADGNVIIQYKLTPFNKSKTTDTGFSYSDIWSTYEEHIKRSNGALNIPISASFWAPAYYDAVWSLAFALNNSIEPLNKLNLSLMNYKFGQRNVTNVIREQIEQTVNFEGLSGRIEFDSQTGYVRRIVDIYQINNGSVDLVAYYNADVVLNMSQAATFIDDTFQVTVVTASLPLAITLLLFTVIALLILIASQILSVFYRGYGSIRASSPKLNHLAYTGCYLLIVATVCSVAYLSFELPAHTRCIIRKLLNACGYTGTTLQISVILVKTWRLYRILVHFQKPGRLISDKVLTTFVLLLTTVTISVNILWITLDPFTPETLIISENGDSTLVREQCTSKYYFAWFGTLSGFSLTIILPTLFLARLLHRVPTPTKDFRTTSIILLVYIGTLVDIITFCTYFLCPPEMIDLRLASLGSSIVTKAYLFLIFLFLPPIVPILKQKWLHNRPIFPS